MCRAAAPDVRGSGSPGYRQGAFAARELAGALAAHGYAVNVWAAEPDGRMPCVRIHRPFSAATARLITNAVNVWPPHMPVPGGP
ncbi:hypothetical protein [Streptomyces pinistramenti]|uniref:hypothetical protein n=1 Tax=Streptomyces pinistramenti TaxID=2884812 RepID=UPI001D07075F|nr:hypothetical protein [Streptomyces pinistramenti]MCB5907642.1 hypothetical protein [Streptomyces pinistramenti]